MKHLFLLCTIFCISIYASAQNIEYYGDKSEYGHYQVATAYNGYSGIIDYSKDWIIPPIYQDIHIPKEGYVAAKKNGKWGLINMNNETIVPFRYAGFKGSFTEEKKYITSEGFIMVQNFNHKMGILNIDGDIILDFKYDDIDEIYIPKPGEVYIITSKRYSIAGTLMELHFIDMSPDYNMIIGSKTLIPESAHFSLVRRITSDIYAAQGDIGAGLYDDDGRCLTEKLAKRLGSNIHRFIGIKMSPYIMLQSSIFGPDNGGWGLYKVNNKELDVETIIPAKFKHAEILGNSSLIKIGTSDDHFGVIDFFGDEVLPTIYDDISFIYSEDHYLSAKLDGQCQLMRLDGTPAFSEKYEEFRTLSSRQYIGARKNGLWGIIDNKGNVYSKFIYDEIKFTFDGRKASVKLRGKDKTISF